MYVSRNVRPGTLKVDLCVTGRMRTIGMQLRNIGVRSEWIYEKAYFPQLKRVGFIFITYNIKEYTYLVFFWYAKIPPTDFRLPPRCSRGLHFFFFGCYVALVGFGAGRLSRSVGNQPSTN